MRFNADVLSLFLKKVYGGFDTSNEVEPVMWREVLRVINEGTVEGLSQAAAPPAHDRMFYESLRHSNEVFAAFKVHAMGEEMAARLFDSEGSLKPFGKWVNDVAGISSHQVGSWLRTEYDTAVIRAHAAADWREFERNRDIFPNLRWMPTTSPDPESSHRQYWQSGLTLPVDDPFWNSHHPGDRWNCKCSLEATDDPVVRPAGMEAAAPQKGLENNPGKDGHIFNDTHPYFPDKCSRCEFYKPGIKGRLPHLWNASKKDCFNCPYINSKLEKIKTSDIIPPKVDAYKEVYKGMVFTSPYHGENEKEENERLAKFIADKLKSKVYLLPRLDPENPEQKALRSKLLPQGVFENKNPDYLIGGRLFDGKSMYGMRRNATPKQQKNAIENHIKKAKKQADNIILQIPSFVPRETIHRTVTNYLSRSKKQRIVMVHWKNKLLIYGQ